MADDKIQDRMRGEEIRDDELSRLIACVRADADPALWTRVRARIEARERVRVSGWLAWWMRPVALRAALAAFVVAAGASTALLVTAPRTLPIGDSDADNLTDALVAEVGTGTGADSGAPVTPATVVPDVTSDSGGVQ